MANKKFKLIMLVMVLVFGVMVVGCDLDNDDASTSSGRSGNISVKNVSNRDISVILHQWNNSREVYRHSYLASGDTITWSNLPLDRGFRLIKEDSPLQRGPIIILRNSITRNFTYDGTIAAINGGWFRGDF